MKIHHALLLSLPCIPASAQVTIQVDGSHSLGACKLPFPLARQGVSLARITER